MSRPTVAIIGASKDRSKYGNKSVRAHASQGYEVFPVHPSETEIEGFKVYRSVTDIPVPLDRVSLYLPPHLGVKALDAIAAKGTKELFVNPGAESDELVSKAKALGLEPILACSIVAVGGMPAD